MSASCDYKMSLIFSWMWTWNLDLKRRRVELLQLQMKMLVDVDFFVLIFDLLCLQSADALKKQKRESNWVGKSEASSILRRRVFRSQRRWVTAAERWAAEGYYIILILIQKTLQRQRGEQRCDNGYSRVTLSQSLKVWGTAGTHEQHNQSTECPQGHRGSHVKLLLRALSR